MKAQNLVADTICFQYNRIFGDDAKELKYGHSITRARSCLVVKDLYGKGCDKWKDYVDREFDYVGEMKDVFEDWKALCTKFLNTYSSDKPSTPAIVPAAVPAAVPVEISKKQSLTDFYAYIDKLTKEEIKLMIEELEYDIDMRKAILTLLTIQNDRPKTVTK